MKNLRGFDGGGKGEQGNEQGQSAAQLTQAIASAYNGKSGADIWLNILREAERAKRAGTLSNEELDEFYQQFTPLLNDAQRKQLQTVIEKLKKI